MSAEDDEDGRDPGTGRFTKGTSGNRRGRPRKPKSLDAMILSAANAKVTIRENGRKKRIPKFQAAMTSVMNSAATTGDPRAAKLTYDVTQKAMQNHAAEPAAAELSRSDQEAVERIIARLRRIDMGEPEE